MCGITGLVSWNERDDMAVVLRRMTDTIRHRGPDGEGFVLFNGEEEEVLAGDDTPAGVLGSQLPYAPSGHIANAKSTFKLGFGHRRLAILDLEETGHQPMCGRARRLWITYNGEIYNYKELKEELTAHGHRFIGTSDTEVIINAYRQWGKDCLQKFNGMWSFVLYDRDKNILFAARDRTGVKPFYYVKNESFFAFASEQKALTKSGLFTPEVNSVAVFDFFLKGQLEQEEEGFFKGIIELFPAHAFTLDLGSGVLNKWKYYTLPVNKSFRPHNDVDMEAHATKIRGELKRAVNLRLRADVPIGSCLSGGIDSSTIVGIAAESLARENGGRTGDKLKVFTATFAEEELDEGPWAALVVNRSKADWHKVTPTAAELSRDLDDLIYCQDIPIWSTSTYAQFRVMLLAKKNGIKVVLDGQGADELFGGYGNYTHAWWSELFRRGRWKLLLAEMKSFGSLPSGFRFWLKQQTLLRWLPMLPGRLQLRLNRQYYDDVHWLNPNFLNQHKQRMKGGPLPKGLNNTLAKEFYNTRLKTYLRCEDRCSMWHSVESRTPFADDKNLIEAGFAIPASYKIHRSVMKAVLREAAAPFLPEEIKERTDKMGYAIPNNKWIAAIKEDLRPLFTEDLAPFLNIKEIQKNFDEIFSIEDRPENTSRVFKLIAFAKWYHLHFK